MNIFALLGAFVLNVVQAARGGFEQTGRALILLGQAAWWAIRPPYRGRELLLQIDFIGVQSGALILVTGTFTGMVVCLQGFIAMDKFGAESLVGAGVVLSLTRELGPVLTALMVIGRAGSAMTAELGSMRNTEQIDALSGMAVDPVQFLVVPRLLACLIVLPALAVIFEFFGMLGAYGVATTQLGVEGGRFMASVRDYLTLSDITHGLVKTVVFGLIIGVVSCSRGFFATGGSRGVGVATTRAVVISSLLVLASDYVMTALMFTPKS